MKFSILRSDSQYLFQKQPSQFRVCVFQRVQLLDQIMSIR